MVVQNTAEPLIFSYLLGDILAFWAKFQCLQFMQRARILLKMFNFFAAKLTFSLQSQCQVFSKICLECELNYPSYTCRDSGLITFNETNYTNKIWTLNLQPLF